MLLERCKKISRTKNNKNSHSCSIAGENSAYKKMVIPTEILPRNTYFVIKMTAKKAK